MSSGKRKRPSVTPNDPRINEWAEQARRLREQTGKVGPNVYDRMIKAAQAAPDEEE